MTTQPIVRSIHPNRLEQGSVEMLATLEQWIWERFVSVRKRPTLVEIRDVWAAMRAAREFDVRPKHGQRHEGVGT